ncbi:tail fiber assembly protein [Chromobacterium sp. Beijing]|uniref:tail fiber assembly protein n=1 Tax=Chromobacterium sp. Beijing TaxID=2735795 RepID=UPI001F3CC5EA|nr:tail fiber assembly protein [Chromobacterium sp. Beijing]UJB33753.1 tail fiber assembly protein [Chromobacterium sp. Beijing]
MITIYHYHPVTGEYLSTSTANASPLEPGVWLLPAHASKAKPPVTAEREIALFRDGAWVVEQDWRGIELWSKATAARVQAQLGDSPDSLNATELEPPPFAVWSGDGWSVDANAQRAAQAAAVDIETASRRAAADAAITPLEDAVELDMATPEELAALKAWKRCRVLLSRVPQQAGYPMAVDWPPSP